MSDAEFEWSAENEDVITHRQDAIAVYENAAGSIVVRREREWDEDTGVFIIISKANIPAFVDAVLRAAGSDLGLVRSPGRTPLATHPPDVDQRAMGADRATSQAAVQTDGEARVPKDPTAAERQRRSRASRKAARAVDHHSRDDSGNDQRDPCDSHADSRDIDQPELKAPAVAS